MQYKLVQWYNQNKRDLPWRNYSTPYTRFVSEIMLQQTRVDTVIPYFNNFIDKFPDLITLSNASEDDLYKAWQGLGYYSRVRNMQTCAKQIIERYNGIFPDDVKDLESLKGIGPYTSRAIASMAYNIKVGAIDGNALRILSRVYLIEENIQLNSTKKRIQEIADHLIQDVSPASFNQGLMDLGATICLPKNPKCNMCPLVDDCLAYKSNKTDVLPINIKKVNIKHQYFYTCVITYKNKIYIYKNKNGLLKNLYGFVQYETKDKDEFITMLTKDYKPKTITYLDEVKHVFSHRIYHMKVVHVELDYEIKDMVESINDFPVSTCHLKVYKVFKKG